MSDSIHRKPLRLISQTDVAHKAVISPDLTEHGLKEAFIDHYVGCGVFAERNFAKGDFLLVYRGDLIDGREAYKRERAEGSD